MDLDAARQRMVDRLIQEHIIHSPRVEEAVRAVPRHAFIPSERAGDAYRDAALPLDAGQTISAPHMVALMAEALDVQPGHRILEVGGGSGYHAAILAHLAAPGGRIDTVERLEPLARAAEAALRDIAPPTPVTVHVGDGSEGLADHAPYDRISVAAAAPDAPQPLLDQLAPGGILVVPVGPRSGQHLLRYRKESDGTTSFESLTPCVFVPLVGRHGWQETDL